MRAPSIPPRVFGFVGTLVVVTLFSVFNLDHRSPVSFGFHIVEDVPIFIACLTSFTFGAVVMVPLVLRRRVRAAGVEAEAQRHEQPADLPERGEGKDRNLPGSGRGDAETEDPRLPESGGHDAESAENMTPDEPRRAWWRPWGARRDDPKA